MNCPACTAHLRVLRSAAGWYIGTTSDCGPVCRVSGYFDMEGIAQGCLDLIRKGDGDNIIRSCAENAACPGYAAMVKL